MYKQSLPKSIPLELRWTWVTPCGHKKNCRLTPQLMWTVKSPEWTNVCESNNSCPRRENILGCHTIEGSEVNLPALWMIKLFHFYVCKNEFFLSSFCVFWCFFDAGEQIRKRRCKAAFSYAPQHEDELELRVGDVIEIITEVRLLIVNLSEEVKERSMTKCLNKCSL